MYNSHKSILLIFVLDVVLSCWSNQQLHVHKKCKKILSQYPAPNQYSFTKRSDSSNFSIINKRSSQTWTLKIKTQQEQHTCLTFSCLTRPSSFTLLCRLCCSRISSNDILLSPSPPYKQVTTHSITCINESLYSVLKFFLRRTNTNQLLLPD